MKTFKQMQLDNIEKNYKEHRGSLIKKYRSVFGKYVMVIDEQLKLEKIINLAEDMNIQEKPVTRESYRLFSVYKWVWND